MEGERQVREEYIQREVNRVLIIQTTGQTDTQTSYGALRRGQESHHTACLYLPAPLLLYEGACYSSFRNLWTSVGCFVPLAVNITLTGAHGRVWQSQGASQELQSLFLQKLQSGKRELNDLLINSEELYVPVVYSF